MIIDYSGLYLGQNIFCTTSGLASYIIAESCTAAETITPTMIASVSLNETTTSTDTITPKMYLYATLTDSGAADDTSTALMSFFASVVEALSSGDTLAPLTIYNLSNSESGNSTDSTSQGALITFDVTDTESLSDSYTTLVNWLASIEESSVSTDDTITQVERETPSSEALILTDSFNPYGIYNIEITEDSFISDGNSLSFLESISDSLEITDTTSCTYINDLSDAIEYDIRFIGEDDNSTTKQRIDLGEYGIPILFKQTSVDLSEADTYLVYTKPSGEYGYWTGILVEDYNFYYMLQENDIDEAGLWALKGFAIWDSKQLWSDPVSLKVKNIKSIKFS